KIRQLKSRISYSIFIPSLTPEEVCSYLNYRMRRADYEGLDVFELKISKKIHRLSEGIPRTINTIADKLLMSAYSLEDTKVTKKHIAMLPKDIVEGVVIRGGRLYWLLLLALVSAISVALYLILMSSTLKVSLSSENISLPSLSVKESTAVLQNSEMKSIPVLNLKNQVTPLLLPVENIKSENLDEFPDSSSLDRAKLVKQPLNSYTAVKDGVESPKYRFKSDDRAYFRVNGSLLSNRLVGLHLNTVEWLMQMPEQMYVIQLASPHISTLEEAMVFYLEQNVSMDSIHLLIDLGRSSPINRFRVLYLASASYSTLERIISELPPEIMKSSPYIVTVGGVLKNMQYTQNNLKQHGIINVTQ
ncbi:MAG: hypothetical protein L3J01_01530, partial [Thiomicrorhabdus sp.]|nr:hypothetical protein [Thiomicrorhabdus sp.]